MHLLHANRGLLWTDFPLRIKDLQHPEIKLEEVLWDNMEWKDSTDFAHHPDLGDLAARQGFLCSVGILIDSGDIYTLSHPERLSDSYRDLLKAEAHPAIKASDEIMETLIPGWKQRGEELAKEIAEGHRESRNEAIEAREELLSGEAKPELMDFLKTYYPYLHINVEEPGAVRLPDLDYRSTADPRHTPSPIQQR